MSLSNTTPTDQNQELFDDTLNDASQFSPAEDEMMEGEGTNQEAVDADEETGGLEDDELEEEDLDDEDLEDDDLDEEDLDTPTMGTGTSGDAEEEEDSIRDAS